jgi:2-haloacid dehalogenase
MIDQVVFDLGGVLVDWNPRYLYRKLFADEAAMERFLAEVCTQAWNEEQDLGRPFAEGVALLAAAHPRERALIEAYDARWLEMLGDAHADTLALVEELRRAGVPLYALSNWSAEKFAIAAPRYPWLGWFRGVVISGQVRCKKPDAKIFRHLIERYRIAPERTLFVDDAEVNVAAARALGFVAVRHESAAGLGAELARLGLRR